LVEDQPAPGRTDSTGTGAGRGITYLPTADRFAYLSLVTDAYSRKIVGYHVHDSLQTEQVSEAFKWL
jgi:transposase InsO family protein